MGDADDRNAVQSTEIRRSRRDRHCYACDETIARGMLYAHESICYDGRWSTTNRCGRCEAIYQHLLEVVDSYTAVASLLDCGHDYEDEEAIGKPPPPEVAALAFVTPREATELLVADYQKQQELRARRRADLRTLEVTS